MYGIIFFEVNTSCTFGCSHCYQADKRQKLSVEEAVERALELQQICTEPVPVFGEPLLQPEYLAVVAALKRSTLPTTGVPLLKRPELAAMMREHGITQARLSAHYFSEDVQISPMPVELLPRINEILRGNGIGSLAHIVLHRGNYARLDEICTLALADGFTHIRLLNLIATNPAMEKHTLGQTEIDAVFAGVEQARQRFTGLGIHLTAKFGPPPVGLVRQRADKGDFCFAGRETFYVRVDGSVFPCMYLTEPRYQMGIYDKGQITLSGNPLGEFEGKTCYLISSQRQQDQTQTLIRLSSRKGDQP